MLPRPLLLSLGAGLISATGFAPLGWWGATLLAFALWLRLVHEAPTLRNALLRGWVFGVGHFTVGNNWIQHAFDFQDKMPPVLGYVAVVALALYLAVFPALAGGLAWRFARVFSGPKAKPDLGYVLVAAAAWIVSEWLRSQLFTGYPWNPLGVTWLPLLGVAQLAAWVGTYALGGLAILASGALLLAAQRRWRFAAALAAALALCTVLLWPITHTSPASIAERPLVRIVQPNIGQEGVADYDAYAARTLGAQLALSGYPQGRPRLVVWPEGMVNYYIESGYALGWYRGVPPERVRDRIAGALGPEDVALVGGNALFFNDLRVLTGAGNSVFVVDAAGRLRGRYDKAHLVPYGEYLPLRSILQPLGLSRLVMGDIDFIPGPGPRTLDVPGFGKVGMQICYEIIFSGQVVDPADRPALLFNPSNDAWFGAWGPPQHLAQARMRAIEEGLPIIRSTPTGISALIDARGTVLESIPAGVAGAIERPIPAALPPTPFARLGNWLAFLVAGLFVGIAIAIRRFAR